MRKIGIIFRGLFFILNLTLYILVKIICIILAFPFQYVSTFYRDYMTTFIIFRRKLKNNIKAKILYEKNFLKIN